MLDPEAHGPPTTPVSSDRPGKSSCLLEVGYDPGLADLLVSFASSLHLMDRFGDLLAEVRSCPLHLRSLQSSGCKLVPP